jgi:phospholipid transport system substrate-binding protein
MRLLVVLAIICSILFCGGMVKSVQASEATPTVKAVLDQAMEIQTRPDLAGEDKRPERKRLIGKLILDSFIFSEMARDALKENWDRLATNQRSEFQRLFSQLFQDSYTRMVLNFLQRESIEYKGETAESPGMLVKTVILRANEHIPVDYHLIQKSGRWLIRDVDIDSVSIVENYRNTFRQVIRSSSFDGLLNKMRLQARVLQD